MKAILAIGTAFMSFGLWAGHNNEQTLRVLMFSTGLAFFVFALSSIILKQKPSIAETVSMVVFFTLSAVLFALLVSHPN